MKRFLFRGILTAAFVILVSASCEKKEAEELPAPGQTENGTSGSSIQKYPGTEQIKIISFNVRCSTSSESDPTNNWDYRKDACLAMIKDQKPSVIGFQEAVYGTQWTFFKEKLASEYSGDGVGRNNGKTSGEVMGILYRKADIRLIGEMETFWLSNTPDVPSTGSCWDSATKYYRSATVGIFEVIATGKRFCYINTHLDLYDTVRAESMKLIASKFKDYNPEGYPEFLTADFNALPSDAIFNAISGTMSNAQKNAPITDSNVTYNGWGAGGSAKIIDMIWYSRATATPVEYHCINESYNGKNYISDHFPIYAIFTLK